MLTMATEMLTDVPELICSSKDARKRRVSFFLQADLSLVLPRNDIYSPKSKKAKLQEKANLKILLQILEHSSFSS